MEPILFTAAVPWGPTHLAAWLLSVIAVTAIVPREVLAAVFFIAVWGILRVPANQAVAPLLVGAGG